MENNGWIKLHRKMLDNPIIMKDADHLAIWMYLLLNATHAEYPALFKGEKIMLQPGQLITGRKSIAAKLSINESKVRRVLECFENDQQIDRQRSNQNTLISLKNWDRYQCFDQQSDQQMTNERPTSDQRVTTNNNVNNVKNERKQYSESESTLIGQIVDYLNAKAKTNYKASTKKTQTCIHARLAEGYSLEDFKTVVDKKCADWMGTEWEKYIRPETLFGTKFESYLNAKVTNRKPVNTGVPIGNDQTDLDSLF